MGGKIVFCNVNAHAAMLLGTCRYARDFWKTLVPTEEKVKNMLCEIVMPYLERQIAAAEKE